MTLKKPLKGTYDILNAINDNFRESNSLGKLIKKIISFLAQKKEEGFLSNILIWERLLWSIPPKGFKRFFLLWKKKKSGEEIGSVVVKRMCWQYWCSFFVSFCSVGTPKTKTMFIFIKRATYKFYEPDVSVFIIYAAMMLLGCKGFGLWKVKHKHN